MLLLVCVIVGTACSDQGVAPTDHVSQDRLWREVRLSPSSQTLFELTGQSLTSSDSKLFSLNIPSAQRLLASAPARDFSNPGTGVLLTLPTTTGAFEQFRVQRYSIFSQELQNSFPDFQTFTGVSVSNPGKAVRVNFFDRHLSAMTFDQSRRAIIREVPGIPSVYVVSSDETREEEHRVRCSARAPVGARRALRRQAENTVYDTTLKTYRLALATTAEFCALFRQEGDDDTAAKKHALEGAANMLSMVDAIYERELAIHFELVPKELDLMYVDATHEPYTNSDVNALLSQNQSNLDNVIRDENYDIGHVLNTNADHGGLAVAGVCQRGLKAEGESGINDPRQSFFPIDFIAHEIGHQFGASHTFNALHGWNGSPIQRVAETAVEPGSGSTIMGYAGVCGSEDVEPHSSAYFHAVSLEQIQDFVVNTGHTPNNEHPLKTDIGNHAPSVIAPALIQVPRGTPFILSASGSDPDRDALTYCWEETDPGADGAPPDDDSDGKLRPLFRSREPATAAERRYPFIDPASPGTQPAFEHLPTRISDMRFRVTVRDGRGGTAHADSVVQVRQDCGPFRVLAPDGATVATAGHALRVAWDTASTDTALGCASVNIYISSDGGASFKRVASAAPNSGTATVTAPNQRSDRALAIVEGVTGTFFAVSPVFRIQ